MKTIKQLVGEAFAKRLSGRAFSSDSNLEGQGVSPHGVFKYVGGQEPGKPSGVQLFGKHSMQAQNALHHTMNNAFDDEDLSQHLRNSDYMHLAHDHVKAELLAHNIDHHVFGLDNPLGVHGGSIEGHPAIMSRYAKNELADPSTKLYDLKNHPDLKSLRKLPLTHPVRKFIDSVADRMNTSYVRHDVDARIHFRHPDDDSPINSNMPLHKPTGKLIGMDAGASFHFWGTGDTDDKGFGPHGYYNSPGDDYHHWMSNHQTKAYGWIRKVDPSALGRSANRLNDAAMRTGATRIKKMFMQSGLSSPTGRDKSHSPENLHKTWVHRYHNMTMEHGIDETPWIKHEDEE